MVEFPNQRVSRNEKEKDSFFKPTYDNLISRALNLNKKDDILAWLDAANGKISTTSLNYLISPLKDKKTEQTLGKLPGELRDTDLINTVRERNMGEYIGLPYKFTVTVNNADAVLKRDLEVREEINKYMQQALINMLNEYYEESQKGINTGVPSKEVPDIEKFAEKFISKWIDKRAIQGLNILKLVNDINDFDTKRIQSFFYWWACEEFYTYREIINNEVYTSNISPLEGYPIYNDAQFVEDYTAFVIKRKTTLTQVKNLYWNELNKTEQDYIESLSRKSTGGFNTTGMWLASRTWDSSMKPDYTSGSNAEYDVTDASEALDHYIIIWRTEVPVKVRTFIDSLGNELEEVVPENYEQNEFDLNVRTEWIEEVYVGNRFGNQDSGIYVAPKPCDVQRYDKHTLTPKLPVGGKKGILRNIKQNPIPRRLITFAIIDRMLILQQERTIGKYEGYIKIMPKSMLNDDAAGSKDEKIFYMKADNTLFYDDSVVDFNTVAQGFRVVSMPDIAQYLKTLIDLRDKYKAEALEIANMNSYTLGDVSPSTGKGVMQESIYRARIGNVLSITMFNAALERDHTADLEFSKIAYKDGKRGSYIDRSTGTSNYIDVNIEEHLESDYGIILENAKIDEEKIKLFRQIAFNASQNGDIESAVVAVDYDSVPELRQALLEIAKKAKEFEERMTTQQSETQKYVADSQTARQDSINETTKYVADKNSETAITVADIKNEPEINNVEPDLNVLDDNKIALQRDTLNAKINDNNRKYDIMDKDRRSREMLANKKLQLQKNKSTTSK